MDHFKGISKEERYSNDLLNETRRMNTLLEQLVQLLQPKIEKTPIKNIAAPKKTIQKKITNQRRKIS